MVLSNESNIRHSEFIQRLVRRLGCRDFDELWDHLFECNVDQDSTAGFVGRLATYCDLSRASYSTDALVADATLAREAIMVKVIRAEYSRLKKPRRIGSVLVVTGGFHTVVLPAAVARRGNPRLTKLQPTPESLLTSWLIRYSFDQLDSLAGYQSGMPNPGFYDAIWNAHNSVASMRHAIAGLISKIARRTRGQSIAHEASVTDSIAALQMMDQLALLRGHATPTRSDLIDAVFGCMRKENQIGSDLLNGIVDRILAGDRVGAVPASAQRPPIIDDFHRAAAKTRLPFNTSESRNVRLELYRRPAHRQISFLLHQLKSLEVPYATMVDGPDFVHGDRLSRLHEEWHVQWSPMTEAQLAESAFWGDTVATAVSHRIAHRMQQLRDEGQAKSADLAVDLLIQTCRCGLHDYAQEIVRLVSQEVAGDASFVSVSSAVLRLALLSDALEPLEANRLTELDDVCRQCYQRATHLIDTLSHVPDDQLDASLNGILGLREILMAQIGTEEIDASPLDPELFFEALERLLAAKSPPRSEVAGATAGVLYAAGRMDQDSVCDCVRQYLSASVEDINDACGIIRGLMLTAREVFWRMDHLLKAIDQLFRNWDQDRFYQALPNLRLAFSHLAPKEIDHVAESVAQLHDVSELGDLVHPEISEAEMRLAIKADSIMLRSLEQDGLQ